MTTALILKILLLLFLLFLSALFSGAETAFTSLSVVQIAQLAEKTKRGKLIKKLTDKSDNLLATLLLGNNLVNIAATSLATGMTIHYYGENFITAMTFILTAFILVFSELTPKRIALNHNEFIAKQLVFIIFFLSLIFYPVMISLRSISQILSWPFSKSKKRSVSTEGILQMVNIAENIGEIEEYENSMVRSVFHLNELSASAIMTHRQDVFSLPLDMPLSEAIKAIQESHFSRIPVYKEEPENIVGIILSKEVLKGAINGQFNKKLQDFIHKPTFISEAKRADELFKLFKSNHQKMAIILDEYGGLAGIVTQEDLIEEIFGELYDENEKDEEEMISWEAPNHWIVQGATPLYQIKEEIQIDIPETKSAKTIAGFLMKELDEIPTVGMTIFYNHAHFKVLSMDKNRVVEVEIKKTAESKRTQPEISEK